MARKIMPSDTVQEDLEVGKIKSSYEKALEKIERMGIENPKHLTPEQKEAIARIRAEYDSKIAERKILLKDMEELPREIAFLEQERDRKIREIYDGTES